MVPGLLIALAGCQAPIESVDASVARGLGGAGDHRTAAEADVIGHMEDEDIGTIVSATLYRYEADDDAGRIQVVARVKDLVPGDAYTFWFVVFNDPDGCDEDGCNGPGPDFFTANADVFWSGAGVVAGPSGRARLVGEATEGPQDGNSIFPSVLKLDSVGVIDAQTVEVHVVLRNHGSVADVEATPAAPPAGG